MCVKAERWNVCWFRFRWCAETNQEKEASLPPSALTFRACSVFYIGLAFLLGGWGALRKEWMEQCELLLSFKISSEEYFRLDRFEQKLRPLELQDEIRHHCNMRVTRTARFWAVWLTAPAGGAVSCYSGSLWLFQDYPNTNEGVLSPLGFNHAPHTAFTQKESRTGLTPAWQTSHWNCITFLQICICLAVHRFDREAAKCGPLAYWTDGYYTVGN